MMNLHKIVRGAISALHPDETVILVQSIGQRNVNGKIIAEYAQPISVIAQIQSMSSDELAHLEKTDSTKIYRKAWLNQPARPVAGIIRELARNGDFIQRSDQSWWLVNAVNDDYTRSGWVSVTIIKELKGPETND